MARSSRFKKREDVSKGHEAMRELLNDIWPLFEIYEEYPYDKILSRGYKIQKIPADYHDEFLLKRGRGLHADFCVLDLGIVVEFNGAHHYEPVAHDGDLERAQSALETRKNLDKQKRLMAKEAGFVLVEWPYWEKLNVDSFLEKLDESR